MAFTRFGFKKNWNNANDFATVVNDEARVRADMQALHDESKEGLNKLMGELEAPAAASSIGAKDYEGRDSTTQGALDKLAEELKNVSEINAENLGAQNIALDKKGETTLADQYDTGELAPTVHGALGVLGPLGMGAAALAKLVSPADKLVQVSGLSTHVTNLTKLSPMAKYAEYWWARRKVYPADWYEKSETRTTTTTGGLTPHLSGEGYKSNTFSIAYGTEIRVNSQGFLELPSPVTAKFSATTYEDMSVLAGKYVLISSAEAWYVPADAVPVMIQYGSFYYTSMSKYQLITVKQPGDWAWEYLSSTSATAYPKDTIRDGYEYRYVGQPLANTASAAKIHAGSYVGNGYFGEQHPNVLQFPFDPKLVVVQRETGSVFADTDNESGWYLMLQGVTSMGVDHNQVACSVSWGKNKVSWYCAEAADQLNRLNTVYHYVAIGL